MTTVPKLTATLPPADVRNHRIEWFRGNRQGQKRMAVACTEDGLRITGQLVRVLERWSAAPAGAPVGINIGWLDGLRHLVIVAADAGKFSITCRPEKAYARKLGGRRLAEQLAAKGMTDRLYVAQVDEVTRRILVPIGGEIGGR